MKNVNKSTKDVETRSIFSLLQSFLKENFAFVILVVCVFALSCVISFFDVATRQTVVAFSLDDYEIDQIADRTIIAEKSIPTDMTTNISVEKGEKVIKKGFPITQEAYRKLQKMATTPGYIDYRAFGNNILFLMLLVALWTSLFTKFSLGGQKVLFKEMLLQGIFLLLVYGLTILAEKTPLFIESFATPIIIPASLCVFFIAILFGAVSANYFCVVLSFAVLLATKFDIVPFLFTLASSLAATKIIVRITNTIDLIFASLMLAILNAVFLVVFKIVLPETTQHFIFSLIGTAANGFLSGILVLGLLAPLERLLNTASVFRLKDLDDVNSPILRKLQLNASGTYNHSLMVATLAQSACTQIGANGLLARVAAYYHDIGKMDQSEYFTENLPAGTKSAHADINPSLSISVIRSHVKKSVETALALHFPQAVVDIIAEHHGNSVIESFYRAAAKDDETVTPESCRYTGVPPTTRESAVVMLADISEAACHSLENPTGPRIEKFIDTLVEAKEKHNQLDNCDLTYKDVAKIKAVFVQILTGFYHTRIKYPGQKDPDSNSQEPQKEDTQKEDKQREDKQKEEKQPQLSKDTSKKENANGK